MADILVLYDRDEKVPMIVLQKHIDEMKQATNGEVFWYKTEDEVLADNADAEILFFWGGNRKPPMNFIQNSKKLKWLHTFSAGVDPIINSPIRDMDLIVTNSKGVHGYSMAVVGIGFMVALLRGFPLYNKQQSNHVWKKNTDVLPREIWDQTLVILGAGAVGAHLARLAKAFDMRVIGVKRTMTPLDNYDEVLPESRIDEALAQADIVVNLIPAMPETKRIINAEMFSKMKSSAYFINLSRGSVVDEEALIDALRNGVIAGAALDAVESEPLSPDSPLWDMDNVIITPHCSADGVSLMDRSVTQFCDLVRLYEADEPLYNQIDLAKGS